MNGDGVIGRTDELAALEALLDEVRAGDPRVALVSGDPGIGKTTLVEALCQRARMRTVWGRCWEGGGAPPYWPWVQIVRACLAELGDAAAGRLGRHAADLAPLVPEMGGDGPDGHDGPDPDIAGETVAARVPMFEAVAALVGAVASDEGGLIVALDDLHAADEGSLQLLRHVARMDQRVPLLVAGTYRDAEVAASPEHQVVLAASVRRGVTLRLQGLGAGEVALLLERAGTDADEAMVRRVRDATDGNPLLVYEASRMLSMRPGHDVEVPLAAQGLIHQRLKLLGGDDRRVLAAAAVLGREFDLGELARVLDLPADGLLDALDRAQDVVVVQPVGLGRWSFHHALLRESLLGDLDRDERARLHRMAGQAVEEIDPSNVSGIAHHYVQAALAGGEPRAVDASVRAAEHASAALAFEDAARWYEHAVRLLGPESLRRYQLLVAMGNALLMTDVQRARNAFCDAIRTARAMGRIDLAAEAVLPIAPQAAGDVTLIGTLDDALCELPEEDSALRAMVLVAFARLLHSSSFDRATLAAISRQGMEMARRVGDVPTLWACLWQWHQNVCMDMHTLEERLQVAEELVTLAPRTGNRRHVSMAAAWQLHDCLEAGDVEGARAALAVVKREVDRRREPFFEWVVCQYASQVALHEGEVDEAERLAEQARAAAQRAEWASGENAYLAHRWMVLRLRGKFEQLEQEASEGLRTWNLGGYSMSHHYLIDALVGLGRVDEARRFFEDAVSGGLVGVGRGEDGVPRVHRNLMNAAPLAEACVLLGDVERATVLYQALLPHAHRLVPFGEGGTAGTCARYLGLVASFLGRYEEAERHFSLAHVLHERFCARLFGAVTRIEHAEMLVARDGPDDRLRATELATAARHACEAMRLRSFERRAQAVLDRLAAPSPDRPHFAREGEYWTVRFGGTSLRVRDSKGVQYVARLTARPGSEVSALDLVAADPVLGHAGATLGADGLLDSVSKVAYRRRLDELGGDGDEAAFLAAELRGATGLGGRDRRAPSDAERARQSVTRAIRSAVDRLGEESPALGDHLRATVRTGIRCMYAP